jgi:hypothetical protein
MTNRHTVAALIVLVVGLVAPSSARAQVVPSPMWGEPINTPDRFAVLASYNGEAVYDNETGLVWEQTPSTTTLDFSSAPFVCNRKTVGNRKGWRVPTIQELASLIDPTVPSPGPTLPDGHPFSDVQSADYWSATSFVAPSELAWIVSFNFGSVDNRNKIGELFVWCVRGGSGLDVQR